jgi:23S rRNA pseudouridine1911/1915/1917 synthase
MSDELIQQIKIVYEDKQLLVVDKPCGLVVNRSKTQKAKTLQDFLFSKYKFAAADKEFSERCGIVHRLDKDTSGVLVVAKDADAFKDLQAQFKKREVTKEYIALVHGHIADTLLEIAAPIKRNPNSPLKYAVVEGGRAATTRVEKLKVLEVQGYKYTLVRVKPKSGRTHQIRVHLAALGNFIVRDPIYCTRKLLKHDEEHFRRMLLHAAKIIIKHPKTGKLVEYTAEIPDDFNI